MGPNSRFQIISGVWSSPTRGSMRTMSVTAGLRVRAGYSQPTHVLSLGFLQSQPGSLSPAVNRKTLPELFPSSAQVEEVFFGSAMSLGEEADPPFLCKSLACDPGD